MLLGGLLLLFFLFFSLFGLPLLLLVAVLVLALALVLVLALALVLVLVLPVPIIVLRREAQLATGSASKGVINHCLVGVCPSHEPEMKKATDLSDPRGRKGKGSDEGNHSGSP